MANREIPNENLHTVVARVAREVVSLLHEQTDRDRELLQALKCGSQTSRFGPRSKSLARV